MFPSHQDVSSARKTLQRMLSKLHTAACVTRVIALAGAGLLALSLVSAPLRAFEPAQPQPAAEGSAQPAAPHLAPGGAGEEHGGDGIVAMLARALNFAILAGTLYYLLRSPLSRYLSDRSAGIRGDLANAEETRRAAVAQIDEIGRKMQALPAALDALRAQGVSEMAAEEARIRAAAAAEHERLLEQARREIELQLKIAERDLVAHAAELAVGVATERIKQNITDEDQKRLVGDYAQRLRA
jgi:F-type H+-transporting ATPase subunit b